MNFRRRHEMPPSLLSDLPQQIGELNSGDGCVSTLVPGFRARTFDGLLDRVCRQHTKRYRHTSVVRDPREPASTFTGDVVKMCRRALDDRTECDQRIVAFGERELASDD